MQPIINVLNMKLVLLKKLYEIKLTIGNSNGMKYDVSHHQDAYRLGYNGRLLLERPKHRYIKVLLRACKTYPFLSDDFIKRRGLPLALPFSPALCIGF